MTKPLANQQTVIQIQLTPEQFESIERMFDLINERTRPKEDRLLTISQVVSLLGVTKPTLWRWDKENYLKKVMIGGKPRYKESEVTAIMEGRA